MPQPTRIREVQVGDHVYTVVPQRRARVARKLGDLDLASLAEAGTRNPLDVLGGAAYRVLKVLIPDFMPEWEYNGFADEEHEREDRYIDDLDRSPDHDQIVEAMDACLWANRLDLLKHLGKLLGQEFLEVASRKVVADFLTSTSESSSSPPTRSTTLTTGTTSDPTSDPDGTSQPTPTDPASESDFSETTEPAASAA